VIKLKDILNEVLTDEQLKTDIRTLKLVSTSKNLLPKVESLFSNKLLFGEFALIRVNISSMSKDNEGTEIFMTFKTEEEPIKSLVISISVYGNIQRFPMYLSARHMRFKFAQSMDEIKPKQITSEDGKLLAEFCKIFYPKLRWNVQDLRYVNIKETEEIAEYIKNPSKFSQWLDVNKKKEMEKTTSKETDKETGKKSGLFSKIKKKAYNIFK
jgi:hypothetical protein